MIESQAIKEEIFLVKRIISVVAFIILFVNWYYPFSPISFTKSFTYTQHIETINEFKGKLETLQRYEEVGSTTNLVDRRAYLILDNLEQQWLLHEKTKIKKSDLLQMQADAQAIRNMLIELAFFEQYDDEIESYLQVSLQQSIKIEQKIAQVYEGDFNSRKELNVLFQNLQVDFRSLLMSIISFYEGYKTIE